MAVLLFHQQPHDAEKRHQQNETQNCERRADRCGCTVLFLVYLGRHPGIGFCSMGIDIALLGNDVFRALVCKGRMEYMSGSVDAVFSKPKFSIADKIHWRDMGYDHAAIHSARGICVELQPDGLDCDLSGSEDETQTAGDPLECNFGIYCDECSAGDWAGDAVSVERGEHRV